MTNESLLQIIIDCKQIAERQNLMSYDIFDALTSNWINRVTASSTFLRRVAIQLNAKSPIDLHWLGMKKMQHTKAVSDMLWLNCLMYDGDRDNISNLTELFKLLMDRRINGTNVWGLNFPYATRFIDADINMANLYNTCTTGIAVSEYCEKTKLAHEELPKIYSDLCETFNYINEGNKGFFIYYPGQKHPTYNVNALALFLFSRINEVTKKDIVPASRMSEMVELLVSEQLEDGSWYYSRSEKGKWIDGFHTGFIIESLVYTYLHGFEDARLKMAIDKAIQYYIKNMFTEDGFPKYFDYSGKYPIEAQNCAQAIQTLVSIQNFGDYKIESLLEKLVDNTISTLYSGRGYFYYKKEKLYTNKASYLRWATSPMLVALMYVYKLNAEHR